VPYQVKTDAFEGPLDVLLDMIEKRKLLINDVSLAKVADDYLAYAQSLSAFSVRDTAHFLLIASTLVLIKSKSLLPSLTLTEDEESDIADLERRLRILQRVREASETIRARFGEEILFAKLPSKQRETVFAPDRETHKNGIHAAIGRVLSLLPKVEKLPEAVVKKVVSIEEMMGRLTERIKRSFKMSFKEFAGRGERAELVVSFLALLELIRQGAMDAAQSSTFGDISMESKDVGVPRYH